jgi:hypothetical protein
MIGFRVKSGWATAVLLGGPADAPRVLDRRVVALSDPELPETRQPYHSGFGQEETNAGKISRRVKVVRRVAEQSVAELLAAYRTFDCKMHGAALVVGSVIEPDSIANPHIRAHALEGRLFRTVLIDALSDRGVSCRVLLERNSYLDAANALRRTELDLKRVLTTLGRELGRPWGSNEKLAALAAWTALARAACPARQQ